MFGGTITRMSSKKGRKGSKKGRKGSKKGARRSTAKRGAAKRLSLSTHVGHDFNDYMKARGFAMKAKAALKMKSPPEVRKVETSKATYKYVVVVPYKPDVAKKLAALAKSKKSKKG